MNANSIFFDTCALKWRYIRGSPTTLIDMLFKAGSRRIISELTLVEWSSAFASEYRSGSITYADFKQNERALMTDIADGTIEVVATTSATDRVRALLEWVGIRMSKNLRSGDAMQVVTALEACGTHGQVEFVTCDRTLAKINASVPPMSSSLLSIYVPR